MAARLAAVGDLWTDLDARGQSLVQAAEKVLEQISSDELERAFSAATRKPAPKKAARKKD
jgi:hypothetical protein